MADTTIQWTDKTWNPVRGCSVISPGCINCYAMKQAHRFSGDGKPYAGLTKQTKAGPQWTGKVMLAEDHLTDPLKWQKPVKVFVNSMSDLFHESVRDEWIDRIFAVMATCPQHTFQVLTKRADRMRDYCQRFAGSWRLSGPNGENVIGGAPAFNIWLGVSVENQKYADERIPLLLQTPAAIRFISAEPLLGQVDIAPWLSRGIHMAHRRLNWVIVGGESGPGSRPFDIAWARSIVKQCADADVACFMKQLGAKPAHQNSTNYGAEPIPWTLMDKKGGDMSEWPADLRVREFPLSSRR